MEHKESPIDEKGNIIVDGTSTGIDVGSPGHTKQLE